MLKVLILKAKYRFNIYLDQTSVRTQAQAVKNALFPVTGCSWRALEACGAGLESLGSLCPLCRLSASVIRPGPAVPLFHYVPGVLGALDSRISLTCFVSLWTRGPSRDTRGSRCSRGIRHTWHSWHSSRTKTAIVTGMSIWWHRFGALNKKRL